MTTVEPVDRRVPMPLYAQVEAALTDLIKTEHWKPGDQIATETELCDMFAVSRTVVRQALDDMVQKGLLVRHRGKGTFVAREKLNETWVQRLTGFYEDMTARGLKPTTKVLEQVLVPAPDHVANLLWLAAKADVIRIDRVRSIEGSTPLLHVVTHVPAELCPGILEDDLSSQSLYGLLEDKYGLRIGSGLRSLEAVPAANPHADLLGLKLGLPVMRIESVAYLTDGRPLEHFVAFHRGDRTRLEVEVLRARSPEPVRLAGSGLVVPRANPAPGSSESWPKRSGE